MVFRTGIHTDQISDHTSQHRRILTLSSSYRMVRFVSSAATKQQRSRSRRKRVPWTALTSTVSAGVFLMALTDPLTHYILSGSSRAVSPLYLHFLLFSCIDLRRDVCVTTHSGQVCCCIACTGFNGSVTR